MSIESVQFVEMVRYFSGQSDTQSAPYPTKLENKRQYYCVVCGGERPHMIEDRGLDEVWRCCSCGIGKVFRVR